MLRYALLAALMCVVLDVNSQQPDAVDIKQVKQLAATVDAIDKIIGCSCCGSANLIATTVVIDTSFDTITFRRPDDIVRTVAVENAKAREFIRELKRGDEVRITYSEAVVLEVRPAS